MNDDRSRSDPAAPVTGVAAGGLGTAANLEETQVLRTTDIDALEGADLDAAAGADDGAGEAPVSAGAPEPVPARAPEPVAASVAAARRAEPVPAASIERVPTPRVRSSPQPARGLAGVLAVALVVLAGVAIIATRDDGTAGAAPVVPPAGSITTAETAAPDRENGREGDGDKAKKCNGKGRGNNCDGAGGDDD
jgi:hypothetical protein